MTRAWHLRTVIIIPRRTITGRLMRGQVGDITTAVIGCTRVHRVTVGLSSDLAKQPISRSLGSRKPCRSNTRPTALWKPCAALAGTSLTSGVRYCSQNRSSCNLRVTSNSKLRSALRQTRPFGPPNLLSGVHHPNHKLPGYILLKSCSAWMAPSESTCGPSIASNPCMLTVKHQG